MCKPASPFYYKEHASVALSLLGLLALGAAPVDAAPTPSESPPAIQIRLITDTATLTATLHDTPTTRDLLAQLPLTLNLSDYAGTEKIATLPRKLSTRGAPAGSDPEEGTLAYYAPWGNLAFFYKDFGYSRGLILLGTLSAQDIKTLAQIPNSKLTIKLQDSVSSID